MKVLDPTSLNKQQSQLRRIMMGFDQHEKAMELFLRQHAILHSARMAKVELWSYEDDILDDIRPEIFRRILALYDHSIAWCIWHITRIEDVAMNLLVAGTAQILIQDKWLDRLKTKYNDTGNAMDRSAVAKLSTEVDIGALRDYRVAVGRRTREIVMGLTPDDLKQKVDPSRLQRVRDEGAVVEAASGVIDYWGKRDVAGLLLMPASRHILVHLNEAATLKKRH